MHNCQKSNLFLFVVIKYFAVLLAVIAPNFWVGLPSALSAQDNTISFNFDIKGENNLPADWELMPGHSGRGEALLDSGVKHSGKYSLKLSPGKKNKNEGFGVFTQLDPKFLAGKTVTLQGYGRLQGMGEKPAALLLKADKDNWLVLPQAVQNKFFFFKRTFRVSSSVSQAYLFFIAGGKKGSVWIDDLALLAENNPSAGATKNPKLLEPSRDGSAQKINTLGWEDSAFISPDGNELYFAYMPYVQKDLRAITLGRVFENEIDKKGPIRPGCNNPLKFETYNSTKKEDGSWSAPVVVKVEGVNSFYAAKLSFDRQKLYYVMRDYTGGYGSGDIYMSSRKANGYWGAPINLGPNINTEANEDTPFVTADCRALYFARNRGDALGFEIMVSRRQGDKWTKAEKVPSPINEFRSSTTANHQPFITADGKEFYFTRIQQLYKSDRGKDGGWGKPTPVFPDLPLSGHASVTADGKYLYFLSAKDTASLRREDWSIFFSVRQKDGWGRPKPVD